MKTFKKGQPIVLGMYHEDGGFSSTNADDFVLKLAYTFKPLDEWEIDTKVIDNNPFWWTEPFYLFKSGDYIFHWINENEDIDVKEMFRVENDYYEGGNQGKIIL